MANTRSSTSATPATDEAFGPRRVTSEGLDRERGDSNNSGDLSSPAQEPRHPPERLVNGDGGNGEAQSRVAEGTSGPPRAEGEGDYAFSPTDNILQVVGKRWNEARNLNKAGAFRQLQRDLMAASPFICPGLIPYKDLITIVTDLEKEIKGSSSQAGKSNEELIADFLSGGSEIKLADNLSPPIANHATMEEGESI